MKNHSTKSLTEGSPLKILVGFTLPLLLGLAFQQVYGIVDTVVVGKFLGVKALAGVGSTSSINFLILGFCTGICSGFAIPVAQRFGQQDYDGLRRIVGNILWLSVGFSVVITVVVCFGCRRILTWMHTPVDTFGYAYTYIFIIFLGIPSVILYNVLSGIIRSLGNSRTPLYFLVFASFLNIILDLVLILWAGMGVAGAALATVISQVVAGGLCLVYMIRSYPILKMSREDLQFRRTESGLLLSMGIPMGLQYTITAVGCITLQYAINVQGAAAMAAVTAAERVRALFGTPFDAIGTASATYAGQNVGTGKLDRVHQGTRASFLLGTAYCLAALGITALWGPDMLGLFLNPGETQTQLILTLGQQYLLVGAIHYIPLLAVNLFRFTIQGMGYSNLAMIAGVMELVGRAAFALLLVPAMGYNAICMANPAAWILADLFLIPVYFVCLRKMEKKQAAGIAIVK